MVYKVKKGATDAMFKHKERLVAKLFVHRDGIDVDEVFAPVTRLGSMRITMAALAQLSWPLHHLNFNRCSSMEIYMRKCTSCSWLCP